MVALPEETSRWVRVEAAKADRRDDYHDAMERCLAIRPRKLDWIDGRKPTREELHDRAGLR